MERIKAYNRDEKAQNHFKGEKAALHNKYKGSPENFKKMYWDKTQSHTDSVGKNQNFKVVTSEKGFHTEFIFDKNGDLVTQWNTYGQPDGEGHFQSTSPEGGFTQEQENQLMNGNSVNYPEDSRKLHTEYDSTPVSKYDPNIRKNINGWNKPKIQGKDRIDYYDRTESERMTNRIIGNYEK